MLITLNGTSREVQAATLAALIDELDLGEATVATALNQAFVRAADRSATRLAEGDAVEIVSPRQGG
ncbi:Thiamine biosynthesis protein ThiS [Beijerinckiaceae bacterium RH AL1]|nr:sulfur carrier protein ThiS [Beijerinckiaceae bacterium]VVB42267.1 Thiamine biosynthesis protein ThiS [Beijerinckiaceae bacterium RH AL8]VVB42268.1 Thiamine biosynthesis protein ThiS [Beijerinckiaceae bacterium RH CH11]VVC53222.1 Thiamine biosynthesis protein ThiS [Beijerinckiaceae bacterium RH AL1]